MGCLKVRAPPPPPRLVTVAAVAVVAPGAAAVAAGAATAPPALPACLPAVAGLERGSGGSVGSCPAPLRCPAPAVAAGWKSVVAAGVAVGGLGVWKRQGEGISGYSANTSTHTCTLHPLPRRIDHVTQQSERAQLYARTFIQGPRQQRRAYTTLQLEHAYGTMVLYGTMLFSIVANLGSCKHVSSNGPTHTQPLNKDAWLQLGGSDSTHISDSTNAGNCKRMSPDQDSCGYSDNPTPPLLPPPSCSAHTFHAPEQGCAAAVAAALALGRV